MLLSFGIIQNQSEYNLLSWGENHYMLVKDNKDDIITFYGNKGNYGVGDDSSVGQYTHWKYKNAVKKGVANIDDSVIQHCSVLHMN